MKLKLFGMLTLCGVVSLAVGCKESSSDDEGGGGTGGSGSTTGSTTGSTKSATGPATVTGATTAPTTGTGPGGCDDGTMHTIDSPECGDCIMCAGGDACSAELDAYVNNPDAPAWELCVFGDGMMNPGCPDDDPGTPNDEFDECLTACSAATPGVEEQYIAFLSCAICGECPNNCDAASVCM